MKTLSPNTPPALRSFDVTLHMDPPTATHHAKKIVRLGGAGGRVMMADKPELVGARERYRIHLAMTGRRPSTPLDGPIRLDLSFVFAHPTRTDWHTVKPDRDNLEKTLMDILARQGWIRLDQRVCAGEVRKVWGPKGFVRIVAREMGGEQ